MMYLPTEFIAGASLLAVLLVCIMAMGVFW